MICRVKSTYTECTRGFTLIELLVVIAIAATLATLAAPSLIQFVQRSAMQSVNNDFVNAMSRARSEAVTRNFCTTICKSATTDAAAPRCQPGASGSYGSDDWHMGWIVYLNPTCDRTVTTADPADAGNIILVRQPGDPRYTLVSANAVRSVTFGPQGASGLGAIGSFSLQDSLNANNKMNRSICLDSLGRIRIVPDGGC
ncbi:MAG: hypothetical protein JWQ72_3061 [Polaromonas sp.]|nr:hypothetical protein [Polaromonas sp.]